MILLIQDRVNFHHVHADQFAGFCNDLTDEVGFAIRQSARDRCSNTRRVARIEGIHIEGEIKSIHVPADTLNSFFQGSNHAHTVDLLELGLEEVDVLFLVLQDVGEQIAAHVVAHAFAMLDGVAQQRDGLMLEREVGAQHFLDILADLQLVDGLEVGQRLEEQDAFCQLVGVLHFLDRFMALVSGELFEAPIVEHAVVQPVLVDRGQLVGESLVEKIDDLEVALHGDVLCVKSAPLQHCAECTRCRGLSARDGRQFSVAIQPFARRSQSRRETLILRIRRKPQRRARRR
mgnify:CR=1 FL=1